MRRAAFGTVARASFLRTRAIPAEVFATCPIETARRSGVRVRAYLRDARAAAEGGGLARLDGDGGGERGDGGHGGGDVNARAWECLACALGTRQLRAAGFGEWIYQEFKTGNAYDKNT